MKWPQKSVQEKGRVRRQVFLVHVSVFLDDGNRADRTILPVFPEKDAMLVKEVGGFQKYLRP